MKKIFYIEDFGAKCDGRRDDTDAINLAIKEGYRSKAFPFSPWEENYSVEIVWPPGQDCKIFGTILLPSGIVLNLNGCRLIGLYDPSGAVDPGKENYIDGDTPLIETAYYDGNGNGNLVSNKEISYNEKIYPTIPEQLRVVGSGIKNGTIAFTKCGINATNMQSLSFIEDLRFYNVSAAIRLRSCFYLRISRTIVRYSSTATNQYAFLLQEASNAMTLDGCSFGDCSVAISVYSVIPEPRPETDNSKPKPDPYPDYRFHTSNGVTITNCSFEGITEKDVITNTDVKKGTGILFQNPIYSSGWTISSCYFEGIRYGIVYEPGAATYGIAFLGNFFTDTEFAILAKESSVRVGTWMGNSASSKTPSNNKVDFSANGNDVVIQVQAKSGQSAFLDNHFPSNGSIASTISLWFEENTQNVIARSLPSQFNRGSLNDFAFEGGHIFTKRNQVPFCTYNFNNTTCILDTSISSDPSNILVFNFKIYDFDGVYDYHGFIFGSTVYLKSAPKPGKTIGVNVNNNPNVQLNFGGFNKVGGIEGAIRHV